MPTDDFDKRIDELLELAGFDLHSRSSLFVRGVLERINSQPLPTHAEFETLLQQIERSAEPALNDSRANDDRSRL